MFKLDEDKMAVLQQLCRALHQVNQLDRVSPTTIRATLWRRRSPVLTDDRSLLKVLLAYPKVVKALMDCKRHCSWFAQCDPQKLDDEGVLFSPVSAHSGESRVPGEVVRAAIESIENELEKIEKGSDDQPDDLTSIVGVLKPGLERIRDVLKQVQGREQTEAFTACPAVSGMSA